MSDAMLRAWGWVARRRLLAGWSIALVCLAVFGGGVTLGAREGPRPAGSADGAARVRMPVVEARVIGRRDGGLVARTRAGDLLLVRTTDRTTYRFRGQQTDAGAVRRGARIAVVGRPGAAGVIVARVIVVRHQPAGTGRRPPPDAGAPAEPAAE